MWKKKCYPHFFDSCFFAHPGRLNTFSLSMVKYEGLFHFRKFVRIKNYLTFTVTMLRDLLVISSDSEEFRSLTHNNNFVLGRKALEADCLGRARPDIKTAESRGCETQGFSICCSTFFGLKKKKKRQDSYVLDVLNAVCIRQREVQSTLSRYFKCKSL